MTSLRYLSFSIASLLLAVPACDKPSVGSTTSNLCPVDGCPGDGDRGGGHSIDPQPFYPAKGWTVFNASQQNLLRGVQWWAYQWQGNTLNVKGYYPGDYGAGVYSDDAHVHIAITMYQPNVWWADASLDLPTTNGNALWVEHQTSHIFNLMGSDGVAIQDITVGENPAAYGSYRDDGTGAYLESGDDVSKASAAVVVSSFLADFSNFYGVLMPPNPTTPVTCDASCQGGFEKYLQTQASYAQFANTDGNCIVGAVTTAICAGGIIISLFTGPPGWLAAGLLWTDCSAAAGTDATCVVNAINSRSQGGTCIMATGPVQVVGPDGQSHTGSGVVVDVYHCDF
jgi:hypothetical protein